jgi:hypothetical protein
VLVGTWSDMRYLMRHWRGELSLGTSFWVNGVLAGLMFGGMVTFATTRIAYLPLQFNYSLAVFWSLTTLLTFVLFVWQAVGIWRAARRQKLVTGRRFWAATAQIIMVLMAVAHTATLVSLRIPAIQQSIAVGALLNEIGHWSINLRNQGHDIEIAGGIGVGIADEFEKALNAAPDIRLVHINLQHGGLISEAIRISEIIEARKLDTYVSSQCVSACTIIYLAGEKRYLRNVAKLGFHAYITPGLDIGEDIQSGLLVAAGVKDDFISRAVATPSDDMWFPTTDELVAATVVTDVVDGSDFAASGFGGAAKSDEQLTVELKETELFRLLSEREPERFNVILEITRDMVNSGQQLKAGRGRIAPIIQSLRDKYLRYADDDSIVGFNRLVVAQARAVAAIDGELCYRHLMNPVSDVDDLARINAALEGEFGLAEYDAVARLIEHADMNRIPPPEAEAASLKQKVLGDHREKFGAADVQATFNGSINDKARGCDVIIGFFESALKLPPAESAQFFRIVAANNR